MIITNYEENRLKKMKNFYLKAKPAEIYCLKLIQIVQVITDTNH